MAETDKSKFPSVEAVESELKRIKYQKRYRSVLTSTISVLVVVAAVAALISLLWMPILQIYGSSMTPTIAEGEVVVSIKGSSFETGDVIAFYYGNKILVKRCIAGPGDWVDIADDGTVYVNGVRLEEPYISEKAYGDVNIEFPYQVPDERYFVLGDHRETSIDSRNTAVGNVAVDQVVGKVLFRIWPLNRLGFIN